MSLADIILLSALLPLITYVVGFSIVLAYMYVNGLSIYWGDEEEGMGLRISISEIRINSAITNTASTVNQTTLSYPGKMFCHPLPRRFL